MKDDTVRRPFPGVRCSDCGVPDVNYMSSLAKLTGGGTGHFCQSCVEIRISRSSNGIKNLPLGQTDYWYRGHQQNVRITFGSNPQDGRRAPMAMAIDISEQLGLEVEAGYDTQAFCRFYWKSDIDGTHVTRILNQLRSERPEVTITVEGIG